MSTTVRAGGVVEPGDNGSLQGGRLPTLARLWRRCLRLSPGLVVLLAVLCVAGGLAQVLVAVPMAGVVGLEDRGHVRWTELVGPVAVLCLLIALAASCRVALDAYAWKLGRWFNGDLRAETMRAVNRPAELLWLEDPESRQQLDAAIGVGPGRYNPGGAVVRTSHRAMSTVLTISAVVLLGTVSPLVAAIAAVTVVACRSMFARAISAYAVELLDDNGEFRRVDYLRDLIWQPSVAKELRIFALWPWLRGQIDGAWDQVGRRVGGHRRRTGHALITAIAVFVVGFGGALALVFIEWAAGRLTLVASVEALQVLIILAVGLSRQVVDADQSVELGARALPAAAELIRRAAVFTRPRTGASEQKPEPARLECRDLSFRYPWGRDEMVLTSVSLVITPGERVGVVGQNGAGKTTLLKLICGFYPADPGQLSVDGVDLGDLDRGEWQHSIAAVHQDFARYPRSLRFNVAPGADVDSALVQDCLADVGLADLAGSLPDGMDTTLVIGPSLSGGQWQRIAIARALYKVRTGARLLLLDEATANLDAVSEIVLARTLRERAAGLTTIVVSHRLSFTRDTDRIVVLDRGQVVEQGAHDQLIGQKGLYSAMFAVQAAGWAVA